MPAIAFSEGIALSPSERELWIGSAQTGGIDIIDLLKIDLATFEALGAANAAPVPDGLAYAGDPAPPPNRRRRSARSG